jgi:hypothetical protein
MAQVFTDDSFATGHSGLTDMQNIENNFTALKSSFSGASAPSDAVAGMPWFHTTNKILKIRNNANDAWVGVLYGSTVCKTWIYANSAADGWVVDSTAATDRVLSLKGGSLAYNANGGTNAGTWTYGGLTMVHTHTVSGNTGGASAGATNSLGLSPSESGTNEHTHAFSSTSGAASTSAVASDATHRPAAAIGTLQYPNI